MKHMKLTRRPLLVALAALCGAVGLGRAVSAQELDPELSADLRAHAGRAVAYEQLDRASLETVTTPERLLRVAQGGFAPTEIWRALEHGEKVECLSCIPVVSKLLFNDDAKTREISAWWLRRRVFGVFGPGQVYSQMVAAVSDLNGSEKRRAYAAEALGEFLSAAGTRHVATAAIGDPSALVRASAVRALQRLNSVGPNGELAVALGDSDEQVRLAALNASTRVNVFRDVDQIVARLDDPSSAVRTRALEALGALRASDAVVAIVAKLSPENEATPSVRAAAAAALGEIRDGSARAAVQAAAEGDANHFVRDAARVALLRL
ncbi:MAG TPA: HEAT repeat domain-containing protein [Polyangiaceae bacterium]|nr:HEAT repeat domain-containing protein [Polyangiaceae bacterium]